MGRAFSKKVKVPRLASGGGRREAWPGDTQKKVAEPRTQTTSAGSPPGVVSTASSCFPPTLKKIWADSLCGPAA